MTRPRVEEVADQIIAADAARAGSLDRKGKPRPSAAIVTELVPAIVIEEAVGGGPPWALIGGLAALVALVLLGGGVVSGLFGGGTPATPTPARATPTPLILSPIPTSSATLVPATPTASPAELVFPPDTVFDGCIVIDPQGNTTVLAAAFTVFNVQSGAYQAAFLQSPTGSLQGSGGATGGQNPIVVPMRATQFGTYDRLAILAPTGKEVDIGPLRQQLPLELNAETDKPNGCDPAALKAPTQQALAGVAYLQAVAPVNSTAADFTAKTATWTNATTSTQAQSDGAQLLSAFQAVQPQLLVLAAAYPPAAEHLMAVTDAVLKLTGDLGDLSRLEAIGVSAWLERYQSDLAQLSAASNLVRQDLGVAAIVRP